VNWWPLVALGVITFISRLTLFLGVKHLGGLQTSLLGLGELLVTIVLAQIFLGERLSINQWIGALLIGINLLLVAYDQPGSTKRYSKGILHWLNPTDVSPTDFPFKDQ
jgi:drug/metabolite transporter (DMT)-like permease